MIATGILHQASWHWNVLAWMLGFLVLAIGAVGALVVTAVLRPNQGPAWERSLFAWGPAAFVPFGFFVLFRLFQLVEPAFGPGAQHWLIGWIPGMSGRWVHPYDTVVALHVFSASFAAAGAIVHALLFGPPARRAWQAPLPGRAFAGALLMVCAVLLPFLAFRVFVADEDTAVLLEWIAWTPTLAVAVALRMHAAHRPPTPLPKAAGPAASTAEIPDFRKAWVAAGLLDADAKPLVRVHAQDAGGAPGERAARAWTAIRAPGTPPRALDRLLAELPGSTDLFVVGDLPADAERALTAAVLADLVGARGLRVLVLHPRPSEIADALRSAMKVARTWDPGAVVIGADALHEAIAGHQLPAVAVVDLAELGRRLVRMAASDARSWVLGLDLIIVHRPDLGTPVEVTHTAFAAVRWHLATPRDERPAVLATCPDTPAHRAFLERLFPGRTARPVPWEPRRTPETVAWPGKDPSPDGRVPWLARATEQVTRLGEPAVALDPAGRWSSDLLPPEAILLREPAWLHLASAADLRPSTLVEAAATLPHRLPDPATHQSLWLLPTDPVARFLHPARLGDLVKTGRMPRPAPVVGAKNRFLRLAHLDAALREAPNDEHTLRAAFGEDLVDYRLRTAKDPATRSGNHSAWRGRDGLVRSPHLRAPGERSAEPRPGTVTDDVAELVEERSGEILGWTDARTAPTRFYPKRVFAIGARRYRVPMHAFDPKRRKLAVELASPLDRATRPVLRVELELRRTIVDRVTRKQGRFIVHTLTAECLVHETVLAAWVPGHDQEERFEPVKTSYDSEVRFVMPAGARPGGGPYHLAATLESLLPVFLRCEPDDLAVTPVREGVLPDHGPGLAVLDRFVGGMGLAAALDEGTIVDALTWARAMLYECPCMEGCASCTPPQVLRVGPDKQAVLAMLDGL